MYQSDSITKLATALSKAQGEMPAAKFNAVNPFLKNKYADLGSLIKASQSILSKNGLSISQMTTSRHNNIGVTTILMHISGEWLESTISLPLADEKGKSAAQVAGSIISYLRRYSYASTLGMYAEEDTDGETGKKETVSQSKDKPKGTQTNGNRPYSPGSVKDKIVSRATSHKHFIPNEAQINLLRYGLELCFMGDSAVEDKRHTVLHFLTGYESTKNTDGQLFKAIVEDWLEMKKSDDGSGEYVINDMSALEAKGIYTEALKAEGQQELDLDAPK